MGILEEGIEGLFAKKENGRSQVKRFLTQA